MLGFQGCDPAPAADGPRLIVPERVPTSESSPEQGKDSKPKPGSSKKDKKEKSKKDKKNKKDRSNKKDKKSKKKDEDEDDDEESDHGHFPLPGDGNDDDDDDMDFGDLDGMNGLFGDDDSCEGTSRTSKKRPASAKKAPMKRPSKKNDGEARGVLSTVFLGWYLCQSIITWPPLSGFAFPAHD